MALLSHGVWIWYRNLQSLSWSWDQLKIWNSNDAMRVMLQHPIVESTMFGCLMFMVKTLRTQES